ncbi:MAG: hypothetical protein ACJ8AW_24065 [Rhodopila sp.]
MTFQADTPAQPVEDRRPPAASAASAQAAASTASAQAAAVEAEASRPAIPSATASPMTAGAHPDGQSASLAAVQPAGAARQRAIAWARAMTEVAAECAQGLDRLPPTERQADLARIGILSEAAWRLCQGRAPGGAPGRARLLGSTWLAGGPAAQASSASTAKLASQCSPM